MLPVCAVSSSSSICCYESCCKSTPSSPAGRCEGTAVGVWCVSGACAGVCVASPGKNVSTNRACRDT
eukprot:2350054-Pleurochrysis_carterae.AAC.2